MSPLPVSFSLSSTLTTMPKRKQPVLDVQHNTRVMRRRASHATSIVVSESVSIQGGQQAGISASTPVSGNPRSTPGVDCNDDSSDLSSAPSLSPEPKKKVKRKRTRCKLVPSSPSPDYGDQDRITEASGAKSQPSLECTADDGGHTPKLERKRKPPPQMVHDIPDVIRKVATFRGQI